MRRGDYASLAGLAGRLSEFGAVPKGSALFINQGGYEAGYIRHLSISNLTGDAPNHTYEHG